MQSNSIGLKSVDTAEVAFDELCGALAARNMSGLWSRPPMPADPHPMTIPYLWRWGTVAPLAKGAGQVLEIDGPDARRALQFTNPGLKAGTTEALFGAYQYLEPGETALAHRHTPAAIRFVITGSSVYTTVDGDACEMKPGDLILTPNWSWHDHTNYGEEPILWFDGIDAPLVANLESVFFEEHPGGMQEVTGKNVSERSFGALGLREVSVKSGAPDHSPLLRYPYADVDRTLDSLHEAKGGPTVKVEYENPLTGGPVIATMSCQMQRIWPGEATRPQRETGGRIHVVFKGTGHSIIGETEFSWSAGDVFVVPSWIPVEHRADQVSDLFICGDAAVLKALYLHREAELEEPLAATGTFEAQ